MTNTENLKPWPKGVSGNPAGRPKGSKNLATIVRELESEDFNWGKVPIKQLATAKEIGSPWRAIVYVALAKAWSGDVKAMRWLSQVGYGDKIRHEFDEGLFHVQKLEVEIVKPKTTDERDAES
jgi:hypothetical protein